MSTQKLTLLMATQALWIVVTSLPNYDMHGAVGKIYSVPVTEILAILLGPLLLFCFYELLVVTEDGHRNVGFATVLAFTYLGGLLMAGLGVHAASLVVTRSRLDMSEELYSLAMETLHRTWSHGLFQTGYFGLHLLTIWTETSSRRKLLLLSSKDISSGTKLSTENGMSRPLLLTPSQTTAHTVVAWTWTVFMSVFYAIFAALTRTVMLKALFHVIVFGRGLFSWLHLRKSLQRPPNILWSTDLVPEFYLLTLSLRHSILGVFFQVFVHFLTDVQLRDILCTGSIICQ